MTMNDEGGTQPPRTDELDLAQPLSTWMPTHWYPGYAKGMPDLLVGRVPMPPFSRPYKTWIVETPGERAALLAAVAKPVPVRDGRILDFRNGPDATCGRRSRFRPQDALVAHYEPSEAGWPHFIVSAIPETTVRVMGTTGLMRERYVVANCASEEEAHALLVELSGIAGRAGGRLAFGFPNRRSAH